EHRHSAHLDDLLNHYHNIKEALANDRLEEAKAHLADFKNEVTNAEEMSDHPRHETMHDEHHQAMISAVEIASRASNIDEFRQAFSGISEHLAMAVQNQEYEGQTLFLQYCPMAIDGKGATWLSTTREIQNPYMGQKMPGCGETKSEL
ncbi:MAG: DUF3347 domain-containing protein, partial [Balneolaceae bacterium]|nr:DUF3347 domain-containing protein [Balneolaceae bacterium]